MYSKKEIIFVLICLITGFFLRFYNFDKKSLWLDEVHTYNDSRFNIKEQIDFYKNNPTYLHPPLFYIITNQFYPFKNPERDLRIIPLIFGTLSIPMIYLLAKQFSNRIAYLCTISLTIMAYHIYLSQDGRSYSLAMFLGMLGLYFFIKYLNTNKKKYLLIIAFLYSLLFYTSYSSIPFIIFSQLFWFFDTNREDKKFSFFPPIILNVFILLFCLPWIIFLSLNFKGQIIMDPLHTERPGSIVYITYVILHDWMPHLPLMIVSVVLLSLFLFFNKFKKNAIIHLVILILPIIVINIICKLFNLTHFISSRYFINFLPIFLITIYLSIESIEMRFKKVNKYVRFRFIFIILLILSNLVILPLYYRSEKQDIRNLVNYLKKHLREGDNIYVGATGYIPALLHYFGAHPKGRHHLISKYKISDEETGYKIQFIYNGKIHSIYHSKSCCEKYINEGGRLWIIVIKHEAKVIKEQTPFILKGFFDGSFLNFYKFPTDASMYLFLWDPNSPNEKGIDMPIE